MHIHLQSLVEDEIAALLSGIRVVGGLRVLPGALPPDRVLESALTALNDGKAALWHVPSLFVLWASGCAVGSGGFKGEPSNGRVEIGYGVAEILRGCGFATEGARQLVHFAFDQPGITEVYAESATDNIASRRVLQKAGFVRTGQRDTEDDGPVEQWLVRNDDRRPPS